MIKQKKVLILGASGFVGEEILNAFLQNKHESNIYVLENLTHVRADPHVTKVKGTLFQVPKILQELRPDLIIHTARISGKRYHYLGRRRAAIMGQWANQKIVNKALKLEIPILYVSGSLMYGSPGKMEVTEDFDINPISYAIDYQKAERPFLKNLKSGKIMLCRPGWIFGPDSWFKIFFEDVINKHNWVPQYGDGNNIMSIIHRTDLGKLIKEYALQAAYSNIYNLVSPISLTHKLFVSEIAEHYKKEIKYISKEEIVNKYGKVVYQALTCNINLATRYKVINNIFPYKYRSVKDLLK
jgi:nucleoside-diphosphate-sugar epimerase